MSESRGRGLLRLRHLFEVTEAKSEEMAAAAPRFERLADPGSAPRVVSSHNLFQTPEWLAEKMAAAVQKWGRVLEPSAGLGRLYRAARAASPGSHVTLVDSSPECCGELYRATEGDSNCRLVRGDFLAMDAGRLGLFDVVLMNPPFRMGEDVRHVRHAASLLAPGGRLVALVAGGRKRREALGAMCSRWEDLAAAFKAEGTRVDVSMIVIDREGEG